MCGLIGALVGKDECADSRMRAGLDALNHRGPDHQEAQVFHVAGRQVWLGHTRLSIIDLTSTANQPMCSEDGRYVLIFNGEIYNYIELRNELIAAGRVFHTQSDTEVLLNSWAQWGESCLGRLDGMFAFVILDKLTEELTCVRDPFGIKPFLYSMQDGAFYFASELPAILNLLPSRPGPDLQRAYDYLVHGDYDSGHHTFVEGVNHLMPAHVMTVDVASSKVTSERRWWSPSIEQTSTLSFEDAAEAVRAQFLQSVRRQLRSDVPLGVALSGGIDSSAVVCAIRHLEPDLPIHTFSFVTPDSEISEERWVDQVNRHVGAIPHKIDATAEDLANDIDDVISSQGEPFGSTSIYAQYRVFKLARESGITVTLDGQGADELLAGYSGYPSDRALSYLSEGRAFAAMRFARAWRQWPGRSYKTIAFGVGRAAFPTQVTDRIRALAGRETAPNWLHVARLRAAGVQLRKTVQPLEAPLRGRWVIRRLRSSLQYHGLQHLLRHGDRNSMRFSVESRVPFLTPELCNLLYSLPENYLISEGGETKAVFRAAMRGIVPDAVLDRKDKIGFATPERAWLGRIAPILRGWLKGAGSIPILDCERTVELLEETLAGRRAFSWQIWRLVNYVRWWHLTYPDSDGSGRGS